MKQEDLNGMMRSPGEAKTAPAPAELPRCPECGERYLGDGMALCTECAALVTAAMQRTSEEGK